MNKLFNKLKSELSKSSNSIAKKHFLTDKPWALIDDEGQIQKLIFKKDGGLILSKNGSVTEGKWDYFSEAKSLLIDRVTDKLLLNEVFVDENALLFKKDGTENDYFALANENTLPDYNVPKYINDQRKIELKIISICLLSGEKLQILGGKTKNDLSEFRFSDVETIDENFNVNKIADGEYLSKDLKITYYIEDNQIQQAVRNKIINTNNDNDLIIEDAVSGFDQFFMNIGKKVRLNGLEISDGKYYDYQNRVFEVKKQHLQKIKYLDTHFLANGYKIKLEQYSYLSINKGDKIVSSEPIFPIPDGKYRIKGKMKSIKIKNSTIV